MDQDVNQDRPKEPLRVVPTSTGVVRRQLAEDSGLRLSPALATRSHAPMYVYTRSDGHSDFLPRGWRKVARSAQPLTKNATLTIPRAEPSAAARPSATRVRVRSRFSDAWTRDMHSLDLPENLHAERCGLALSDSGRVLALGDPESGRPRLGAVYILTRRTLKDRFGAVQQTIAFPPDSVAFGTSVALDKSGLLLVVGDAYCGTDFVGAVHIFERSHESATFALQQTIVAPRTTVEFGIEVGLSTQGNELWIGDSSFLDHAIHT